MIRTVGIVGYGSFGALLETLVKRFAPSVEVKIHSSRFAPDGKQFFALGELAKCDVLLLAVPIHAFEETLTKVLPLMGDKTVIVDVATVKVHTTEILKRLAGDKKYIATHPMWGPESYEKTKGNIAGFRIVMVDGTLPTDQYLQLQAFLK